MAVLQDAWKRCCPSSGMTPDQLAASLLHRKVPCSVNVVGMTKSASIRFLEMKASRKGYMKRAVELQKAITEMSWPARITAPL